MVVESFVPRRPWWAAFSVRAHLNLRALASDILLYDRIILPSPGGDPAEEARWEQQGWEPAELEFRVIQAADSIYTVPWSAAMRDVWADQARNWRELEATGPGPSGAGYGLTPVVMARTAVGQQEIMRALGPGTDAGDQVWTRPFLIAGYQTEQEAAVELRLEREDPTLMAQPQAGSRDADRVLAMEISRRVEEPALKDPDEAFVAAAELASRDSFRQARANLLDFIDRLVVNEIPASEVKASLRSLEESYNAAVRDFHHQTWKRRAVALLPLAAGGAMGVAGQPHLSAHAAAAVKAAVPKAIGLVTGRFIPAPRDPDDTHPGRALAQIRAAYTDRAPQAGTVPVRGPDA
jgi:hypothetical protein